MSLDDQYGDDSVSRHGEVGQTNKKLLRRNSQASITLALHWDDKRAVHEDRMHFELFDVASEIGSLPGNLGETILGKPAGKRIVTSCAAGELFDSWQHNLCHLASPNRFDRSLYDKKQVEPKVGRFYPRDCFQDLPDFHGKAPLAGRITRLNQDQMTIDLNHPMAHFDIELGLTIEQLFTATADSRTSPTRCLEQTGLTTGLKACLKGPANTDYGDDTEGLSRIDNDNDAVFYHMPRWVQHLDAVALDTINKLYRRLIPAGGEVLDIMASHDSHLQDIDINTLYVLGMNQQELSANKAANVSFMHNLNQEPVVMLTDESVDAVVCTASIEYLTNPIGILAEIRRVLKQDGIFIVTFSNRWFPTKAIQIWTELHEFERVGLVTQWMANTGFNRLHTFSSRGWPRPASDSYHGSLQHSDPVHAVWGYKP